jgi:insulysin
VKLSPRGIRLTLGGYNDKLKEFAAYISKKLATGSRETLPKDDQEFDRYKDELMRGLSGFDAKQPYAHASYYALLTLQPRSFQYSNKELRDATQKITLPDLAEYVKTLWSSGKGEALVQGNFDTEEALDLVKTIDSVLPFRPIPESEYPPQLEALPLPTSGAKISPTRLLVAEPNPSNGNSVAHVMLQSLGKSETDHVLIELISAVAAEPFFNELRTKQQLGYVVSSGLKGIGSSRTLTFIVQSSVAPAEKLGVEIVKFLDSVEERLLEKLSEGDVASYVKSSIDRRTEPDKDLAVEVTRNWSEIASGRLQFDRIQKEAAALLGVEKQDLLDFWKKLYSGDGRRILITEMIPRQGVAASQSPQISTGYGAADLTSEGLVIGIDDIELFRRDRETLGENEILSSIHLASIEN